MNQNDNRRRQAFVFGNVVIDEVFLLRDLPAPGESVHGALGSTGLGGKGANQAIALSRTGLSTTLVTAAGADEYARMIKEAIAREPLDVTLLERADIATDRSIIFAQANGDNVIVTTNACAASLTTTECLAALATAHAGDAVLLQGNLSFAVTAALCRECRDRDLYLVLNPSPFDAAFRDLVPFADVLFVNETEARGLTGRSRAGAIAALLAMGARSVVLTLGREGALLGSRDRMIEVAALNVDVVDVTGAGDCFEGIAVGSALLRGTRLDETALRHASRAAARTIQGAGAAVSFPGPEEVARIISDRVPS